jgi:hypothetical protein
MKFKLYTDMSLGADLPEQNLRTGDMVKLVDHHVAPDGQEGYSVEVLNALGDTIAVTIVPESVLRPLTAEDVLSVRPLVATR